MYRFRDTYVYVMYYVYVTSGPSPLIESTDSMILEDRGKYCTSVPSLRKVLWGQLGVNTSESACG